MKLNQIQQVDPFLLKSIHHFPAPFLPLRRPPPTASVSVDNRHRTTIITNPTISFPFIFYQIICFDWPPITFSAPVSRLTGDRIIC
ncbi:hypothetical protein L1987_00758 [Smallanthus sonchifolius]|uniref:Uncharacterized protein n=1 Tax=Smallanthus sonchifolius TaxID=185202 RepID=A0ACB9K392_9ASTR|nr:hypothetical protein L1987_00758 [Smallanthus sonchifolius]